MRLREARTCLRTSFGAEEEDDEEEEEEGLVGGGRPAADDGKTREGEKR